MKPVVSFLKKVTDFIQMAKHVKTTSGVSYARQITEIIYLYRCNPTCSVRDYFKYGLYDRQHCSTGGFNQYVGAKYQAAISEALNHRGGVTAAWDKLVFSIMADSYSMSVAELKGVFKPSGTTPAFVKRAMKNEEDLRAFLKDPDNFPMYAKPAHCQQGLGGFYLSRYDVEQEELVLKSGDRLSLKDFFAASINGYHEGFYDRDAGYLFQDIVDQHPVLNAFAGTDVPCGIRVVVLNDGKQPFVHRALWKITTAGNSCDNFHAGLDGNLVAAINVESGAVSNAVNNFWPFTSYIEEHSVTRKNFVDFTIPLWAEIISEVVEASKAFSTMKIQHWDVILTAKGPVLLELNDLGGLEFLQLHGKGFFDARFKDFASRKGDLKRYPSLAKLAQQQ